VRWPAPSAARHHRHAQHFQRLLTRDLIDGIHRARIDIPIDDLVVFLAFEDRPNASTITESAGSWAVYCEDGAK